MGRMSRASGGRGALLVGAFAVACACAAILSVGFGRSHLNAAENSIWGGGEGRRGELFEAYGDALQTAGRSQADMSSLVRYYAAHATPGHEQEVVSAVHAWRHHRYMLNLLDESIAREERQLASMKSMDQAMRDRRDAIKKEMRALVDASQKTADDLDALRNKYGPQIEHLRVKYHKTADKLQEQHDVAEQELKAADEEERALRLRVGEAKSDAARYREEARNVEKDIDTKRARAKREEDQADFSIGQADRNYKMRMRQQEQQADSIAEEKRAEIEGGAYPTISRIVGKASRSVDTVKRHIANLSGQAAAQKAVKHAAEAASESAFTLQEELDTDNRHLRIDLTKAQDQELEARGKLAKAKARAAKYHGKAMMARSVYHQVMHDEMTARKRITAAQKIIDAADAKRIVAESGERMAQAVAKGDKKVAEQAMERAQDDREYADRRIKSNGRKERAYDAERDVTFQGALEAYHTKLDSDNIARSSIGRAALHDAVADNLVRIGRGRLDRADEIFAKVEAAAGDAVETDQEAHESAVEAETAAKVAEARQKLATSPTATTTPRRLSAFKGGKEGGLVSPSGGESEGGGKDGHLPGVNV